MTVREVNESPLKQGEDESIAYALTTTPWGSTPTSVSDILYDWSNPSSPTDVSSTNLSGSVSVASDVITTRTVSGLTVGARYRMEIKFTVDGNILETYLYINGEA